MKSLDIRTIQPYVNQTQSIWLIKDSQKLILLIQMEVK